jgi:hypothetical protein
MYAQLVEMGWPILIAVLTGLALIVMGYVLAEVLLYWIGGGLLGAMIVLSMAVAVTGTEAEADPDSIFRTGAWTPFFLALVAGLAWLSARSFSGWGDLLAAAVLLAALRVAAA